jgi:hypothetical protein
MAHNDIFGRPIEVNDNVAVATTEGLRYGVVKKLTPKQVRVQVTGEKDWRGKPMSVCRYGTDIVKIPVNENDIMLHELRK